MKFKLTFQKFDIENLAHTDAMLKWDNDREFNYLFTPLRHRNSIIELNSLEKLKKKFMEKAQEQEQEHSKFFQFLIFDGTRPIGSFSIHLDPEYLYKKIPVTSWLGLIIGEKEYWGSGAAKLAMEFFESESRKLGAKRIELGVFEFNMRAQAFDKKLGYVEIARLKNFTYWDNRFWYDVRMEKNYF